MTTKDVFNSKTERRKVPDFLGRYFLKEDGRQLVDAMAKEIGRLLENPMKSDTIWFVQDEWSRRKGLSSVHKEKMMIASVMMTCNYHRTKNLDLRVQVLPLLCPMRASWIILSLAAAVIFVMAERASAAADPDPVPEGEDHHDHGDDRSGAKCLGTTSIVAMLVSSSIYLLFK